jgi:hypothetical protein
MKIKSFFQKNVLTFIGIGVGVVSGYIYYQQVGCGDSCTIWSSPVKSTLYGALLGGLLFNLIQGEIKKRRTKK